MDNDLDDRINKNDPSVRAVEDAESAGVAPGFMGGSDWPEDVAYRLNGEDYDKNGRRIKRRERSRRASDDLSAAERNASNGDDLEQPQDSLDGNRNNEVSAKGFYSGRGKGKNKKGKGEKKGWLKKGGPIGAIIVVLFGVAGVSSMVQLSQPFSFVAQIVETFNSMQPSASLRTRTLFGYQMNRGWNRDPVRGTIFGSTFKITDKQQEKLRKYGIEYDEDFEGTGKRVLKFDDGDDIKIVAADKATANSFGDISGVDASTGKPYNSKAAVFDDLFADKSSSFHHAYSSGSLTWRGQVANWFGTRVAAFLTNNKLTRNAFNNYEEQKAAADGDGLEAVKETLEEKTGAIENEGEKTREVVEKTDDDGNVSYKKEDSSIDSGKMTRGDIEDLSKKMENIRSKFASSANIICGISSAVGAITMAVTAAETLQVINLATMYFEAIDKVKAGDGEAAPINELADTLNEKKSNTNDVLVSMEQVSDSEYDATIKKETTKKSAMESEGIAALYSGRKVNPSDPSVQSFNLTASIKNIMGGINSSMTAFQTCTIAKLAISAVELASAAADTLACIFSIAAIETGVGAATAVAECGKLIVDIGLSISRSVVIGVAIAGIFSALAPVLQSAWTRDLISNIGGEDLGNALTSGGNMYLGGAHRANGGSPASLEKYEQYAVLQQQVIADNARYERESLSPFDLTSKNTFMGALMMRLSEFAVADSFTSTILSGGAVVSSSIIALSPAASAYDIAKTLPDSIDEYEDTCPYLASIGMIGDAYCNPYVITDVTTINDSPADVIDKVYEFGGLADDTTSDGNVKIAGDSSLAKYIRYCDSRNSMFGATDYNIVNDLNSSTSANTGNTYADAAIDGAIGAIPIVGDGIDVFENSNALANVGYISGESCVAGNDVENNTLAVSSPGWDESKYYQRFIEDQSLAESMGLVEKSAVTAYLEDYYEEHPLDNSYEGVIARYSGLDKETVSDIMAIADYYEYINDYNPAERYAFGGEVVEKEEKLLFDNDNNVAKNTWVVLLNQISYADVRNRNFAV